MTDPTPSGPYGRAAQDYRRAGWLGVLPIGDRAGTKYPPPRGFTGHGAPMPSAADVSAWLETHADRNIGLRLPPGVIGLDVDDYRKDGAQKTGGDSLRNLEHRYGNLPPTWITSARTDGVSGIRFYRVPTHDAAGVEINWPGEAGPNIEIIQTGHRYALVWPSVNPEAGGAEYAWRHSKNPDAFTRYAPPVPRPEDLPDLPPAWVEGLRLTYERAEKGDLGNHEAQGWLARLGYSEPCRAVKVMLDKTLPEIAAQAGSRHETVRDALRAIIAFGAEGHRGANHAAGMLRAHFDEAVGTARAASGEFDRLLLGAVQLAAAKHPQPAATDPCATPTPKALPAGLAIPHPPAPAAVTAAVPTPPAGALTLPAEFWQARHAHRVIRQAAHSRAKSADVVFYGVLVRLAAMAPHEVFGRLMTGVGSGSMNLFAALVGPSGAGKSSGLQIAEEILPSADLERVPLGSGEGLAEAYMGMVSVDDPTGAMNKDGSARKIRQKAQVRHNVLAAADEGASLNKMLERTGSTVGEALRSAWSGETIGQKNGREETTRIVHGKSYSLGLMIGYQVETVLPLLDDVAAGTPQRFLYGWASDPTIPRRGERVEWPGAVLSPFPAEVATTDLPADHASPALFTQPAGRNVTPVTYAQAIRDELYDEQRDKAAGELAVDPYRSQHAMLKVKVATALALLDGGRRDVGIEDWRLAQIILDTSDAVRTYLQGLARDAAARERAAQVAAEGELEGHREHARRTVAAAHADDAVRRVALRLAAKIRESAEVVKRATARKWLASRDRAVYDEAIEFAVGMAWIEGDDEGGWKGGHPLP